MEAIIPVILAGGSGTRLWPLSRTCYPKQFLCLNNEYSLLQQTMVRATGLEGGLAPIVITNERHYFLSQEQLADFSGIQYILEPEGKNTAPSIVSCAHYIKQTYGSNCKMLVLPADHWITDDTAWQNAMQQALEWLNNNNAFLTFGIQPTSPNVHYGYIEVESNIQAIANSNVDINTVKKIKSFHEKPDQASAQKMLDKGGYFWNSGMFMMPVDLLLTEMDLWASDIYVCTEKAVQTAAKSQNYIRLNPDYFTQCRADSIDYALMEKTKSAAMMPLFIEWSDLGAWDAVAQSIPSDKDGNSVIGSALLQETHDSFIYSDAPLVATLGVSDQIVVATKDVVLVADKAHASKVKALVNSLLEHQQHLAHEHLRVARPWGFYEILAEGPTFKVKRLMLKPGAKISLQLHHYRAEHWVVVSGVADIINGDQVLWLCANQSTYIPPKTKHRLSNVQDVPLYVIEVQSGEYLGEDDIVRLDDMYEREKIVS